MAERCANCDATIGNLETPFLWSDSVVCGACHRKLSQPRASTNDMVGTGPEVVAQRHANSIQQVAEGRFAVHGAYSWGFDIVKQAMRDCKASIKEANLGSGLLTGKCPYGINPFGMTVTAAFHSAGAQTIVELSASFTDALDTFGACKMKVRQISDRLMEVAGTGNIAIPAEHPGQAPSLSGQPSTAPAYANRAGPSQKGKAITGFWLSLGGIFIGPAAIVGVVMCGIAITNMSSSNNEAGKGFAKAGLVIGFIAILAWVMILMNM